MMVTINQYNDNELRKLFQCHTSHFLENKRMTSIDDVDPVVGFELLNQNTDWLLA